MEQIYSNDSYREISVFADIVRELAADDPTIAKELVDRQPEGTLMKTRGLIAIAAATLNESDMEAAEFSAISLEDEKDRNNALGNVASEVYVRAKDARRMFTTIANITNPIFKIGKLNTIGRRLLDDSDVNSENLELAHAIAAEIDRIVNEEVVDPDKRDKHWINGINKMFIIRWVQDNNTEEIERYILAHNDEYKRFRLCKYYCKILARNGHIDSAYEILSQHFPKTKHPEEFEAIAFSVIETI